MSIITKRGDEGLTDLLFGKKAEKTSARIEALGAIDELSAHLGVARALSTESSFIQWLEEIQHTLINLMGMVAVEPEDAAKYAEKGYGLVTAEDISTLEDLASESESNTFKGWIKPGASHLSAQLHVCRTVCRRAERRTWATELATSEPRIYLNRLADLLWIAASASE